MHTIKEVFDDHFTHLKFNKNLAHEIYRFKMGFMSKNEESIEFFGGNLMGVHVVRFLPKEENEFFDIFDTDKPVVKHLVAQIPGINKSFIIASDPFNVLITYLIYKFFNSPYLSDKLKEETAVDLAMIMNIRFLTGLMNHYYKYPIDKATAEAVYASLSFKYIIKQKGSWGAAMESRSYDSVCKDSIHYKTLTKLDSEEAVTYFLNDSQGRIRDTMKNIYREFKKVKDSGIKFNKNSGTEIGLDGEESFKDKAHGLMTFNKYLYTILPDRRSFIRIELLNIIYDLVPSVQEKHLVSVLEWLSENFMMADKQYIKQYLDLTLVYSFNYMLTRTNILHNPQDLGMFLTEMRGGYLSSKSTEPDLLELRVLGDKIVTESIKIKTKSVITSVRLAAFLYVCLRTYTKNHYR